jgi:predicted MFS family arabinose efflux permease
MDPERTPRPGPPATGPPATARAALRSRPFTTLLAGYAVSALGDGMAAVAISWLAIELARGHNAGLLVGAAIAAYTLPGVVAALGLGRLLTRWDPRLLVLAEAVLRAACLGLIAAGALAGPGVLTPASYIVLLGISSLLGLLGTTGSLTAVAELLPDTQRVAGNSLITVAAFAATIVGPALAGLVIAAAGAGAAIAADAGSYVVLIAAVLLSRRFQPPAPRPAGAAHGMGRALKALWQQKAVLGITAACVVFYALYGPVEVALPVYVSQTLHAGPTVLGGYWTLFGCGATAGALTASWAARFGLWRVCVAVIAGWGACLVPLGLTDSVAVGFAALAAGGLVYGPFQPLKQTIIQRASPPGALAALAAASGLFTVPAAPAGTALGGPLVAALGAAPTLLASGLATIALAAVAAAVLLRRRRRPQPRPGPASPPVLAASPPP